jgi:hypothetical protein
LRVVADLSATDLALNTFFAFFGACVSVGLALWLEVSGRAERLRNRSRKADPTRDATGEERRASWLSAPISRAAREVRRPRADSRTKRRSEPVRILIGTAWMFISTRYFRLLAACFLAVSTPFWGLPVLESIGVSGLGAALVILAFLVSGYFAFNFYILGERATVSRHPIGLVERVIRSVLPPASIVALIAAEASGIVDLGLPIWILICNGIYLLAVFGPRAGILQQESPNVP